MNQPKGVFMEISNKPRKTKVQIFRDTATDEDWKKLIGLALSTNPIGANIQDSGMAFFLASSLIVSSFITAAFIRMPDGYTGCASFFALISL